MESLPRTLHFFEQWGELARSPLLSRILADSLLVVRLDEHGRGLDSVRLAGGQDRFLRESGSALGTETHATRCRARSVHGRCRSPRVDERLSRLALHACAVAGLHLLPRAVNPPR